MSFYLSWNFLPSYKLFISYKKSILLKYIHSDTFFGGFPVWKFELLMDLLYKNGGVTMNVLSGPHTKNSPRTTKAGVRNHRTIAFEPCLNITHFFHLTISWFCACVNIEKNITAYVLFINGKSIQTHIHMQTIYENSIFDPGLELVHIFYPFSFKNSSVLRTCTAI